VVEMVRGGREMTDPLATEADTQRRNVRKFPDHPALIFGDRQQGYLELNRHSSRVANGLLAPGRRKETENSRFSAYHRSGDAGYLSEEKWGESVKAVVVPADPARYLRRELRGGLTGRSGMAD